MTLEKATQRAFDKANLIGESVDLDGVLMGYKVIRELYYDSPEKYEEIYEQISRGLFGR